VESASLSGPFLLFTVQEIMQDHGLISEQIIGRTVIEAKFTSTNDQLKAAKITCQQKHE
jgi:hypothetical protein